MIAFLTEVLVRVGGSAADRRPGLRHVALVDLARAGRADLRHAGLGHHLLPPGRGRPVRWSSRRSGARTERIAAELDESQQAQTDAEANATRIRQALGDIDSERQRLLAEADAQAAALLADGRARLDAEVAEMEQKAETDIAAAASRTGDELRNEIARLGVRRRRPGRRALAR